MARMGEEDLEIVLRMRKDPPGTVRTVRERIAFERWWDWKVEQAQADTSGVARDRVSEK